MECKLYIGGCHCGAVRFEAHAPMKPKVVVCNCSICTMKQYQHLIVPQTDFKLLSGLESLTTYTFGTHTAKHMFCSKCGVQSFYYPRSDPDGVSINVHCLDAGQMEEPLNITYFDGKNWDEAIKHYK
jgi:hypothetical protein